MEMSGYRFINIVKGSHLNKQQEGIRNLFWSMIFAIVKWLCSVRDSLHYFVPQKTRNKEFIKPVFPHFTIFLYQCFCLSVFIHLFIHLAGLASGRVDESPSCITNDNTANEPKFIQWLNLIAQW